MAEKATSDEKRANDKKDSGPNQGEGDYASAKVYRDHQREFNESGKAGEKAREAEKAFDGKEGDALRRAEEEGKRHSHGEDPLLKKSKN